MRKAHSFLREGDQQDIEYRTGPPTGRVALPSMRRYADRMPSVKTRELDQIDKELLNLIQVAFPLESRPFEFLADKLGVSEDDVIKRLDALKHDKIIRQISMIFDTRALGYKSSLIASRAPEGRVDEVADVISQHPGVSHNYRRNHEFNIWWTIAVPPESSLEEHVQAVHDLAGAESTRVMQTIKMFKIGVDLDMTGKRPMDAKTTLPAYQAPRAGRDPLTSLEIAALRELQEDISLEPAPYDSMAKRIGIDEAQLLEMAHAFIADGLARRFAAVMHHRQAGFVANAMSVWHVPAERIEEVGCEMAGFAAVSHCYQRPTYPDWPYNLFGMLHARTKEECEVAAEAIERQTGVTERRMLYSTKEYKKVRVRYYTDDFFEWESRHLGGNGSGA
jgi:DNA-binding Lrp family transcriptional regulator